MNVIRTTLRMNKWLGRNLLWWFASLAAIGIWMGGRARGWW